MIIKIGPLAFDLNLLGEYNPNYLGQLPPKAYATFGEHEVTLNGTDALLFDKCVSFYLDYKIGSRPDPDEVISRRYNEIRQCLVG